MRRIGLRLPPDLDARLSREAVSAKRTKSAIARAAIAEYLQKQTQKVDRKQFVAACVRGAMARDQELRKYRRKATHRAR